MSAASLRRVPLAVLAVLCAASAQAQTYKCRDAAGKITYSSQECRNLGLRDAGEVADKMNITPAVRPNYPSWNKPQDDSAAEEEKKEPPKAPERRCFTTRNAKGGTSTRCNDTPDDDAGK
jgi:hypothetical protein